MTGAPNGTSGGGASNPPPAGGGPGSRVIWAGAFETFPSICEVRLRVTRTTTANGNSQVGDGNDRGRRERHADGRAADLLAATPLVTRRPAGSRRRAP